MNWEIVKAGFVAAWTAVAGVSGHRPADAPKTVIKPKPPKAVKAPEAKPGKGKVVRTGKRAFLIEQPSAMRFVGRDSGNPVPADGELRILVIRSSNTISEDVQIYVRRS